MPLFSIPSSPLPPDFFAPGAQIEKLRYATYRIYSSLGKADEKSPLGVGKESAHNHGTSSRARLLIEGCRLCANKWTVNC